MDYRERRQKRRICEVLQSERRRDAACQVPLHLLFYWRGWDYSVHDEHTGIRGGYDVLISVTYAINTG